MVNTINFRSTYCFVRYKFLSPNNLIDPHFQKERISCSSLFEPIFIVLLSTYILLEEDENLLWGRLQERNHIQWHHQRLTIFSQILGIYQIAVQYFRRELLAEFIKRNMGLVSRRLHLYRT